ncbi:DeoR/GlpR family DNA-binding transcription regulator [Nonomuraea sp. B1E8]|uniref:DeoR/GlpR family DNA-binding transcription regulator n=1 Tax=unclassified Nonomuraea TaxID=2593643 RepID=UPI00325C66F5
MANATIFLSRRDCRVPVESRAGSRRSGGTRGSGSGRHQPPILRQHPLDGRVEIPGRLAQRLARVGVGGVHLLQHDQHLGDRRLRSARPARPFHGRAFDRQQRILSYVRSEGRAVVSDIADLFSISPATLRRDLRALEAQRLIARSYGVFYPTDIGRYETPVEHRRKAKTEERLMIAEAAVAMMVDVDTVFLDEGALPEDLVGPMRRLQRMTVVTRSLTIAAELNRQTDHDVIMVGGRLRPKTMGRLQRRLWGGMTARPPTRTPLTRAGR